MSNQATKTVGDAGKIAKAGLTGIKLSGLGDAISKGINLPASGAGSLSAIGSYLGAAIVAAKMFATGNDYLDENYSIKSGMQMTGAGMGVAGAVTGNPYLAAGGALVGLGSMLVNNSPPDKPRLFLQGGETVNWGDEGLGGYEGVLWDKYEQGIGAPSFLKGEDYIKAAIADQPQFDENYRSPKSYEQRLAEYEAFKRGEYQNTTTTNDFAAIPFQGYYDWDIWKDQGMAGTQPRFAINPDRWVDASRGHGGFAVKDRLDPIKSAKYGDIYAWQDIAGRPEEEGGPGPLLSIQDLYGGQFAEQNYERFRDTLNHITKGAMEVFNENVIEYLDTLPEAERASMVEKLGNTDFRIDYKDPATEYNNISSEEFFLDDPGQMTAAYSNFLANTGEIVANQLIDQAKALGIPNTAFGGKADTPTQPPADTPTQPDTQPSNEGATMSDQSGIASRYVDYAQEQQGWNKDWDKYEKTLSAYVAGEIDDVQNPGKGYAAVPTSDWQDIAKFAEGIPAMSSGDWIDGGESGGSDSGYFPGGDVADFIEGYDWQDYWDRLEARGRGLETMYGGMGQRLEDVLQARQDMYQVSRGRSDQLVDDILDDYNRLKERDIELQATPGVSVSLGGTPMMDMEQKVGSKRQSTENLIKQGALRDDILNSIGAREGAFLTGWKGDLGDITSMYQAQLNAPAMSYQEFAPHMTRWENFEEAERARQGEYGEAAKQRQHELDMLNQQLASKEKIARMVQEGPDASWADILSAVGAGGGALAQLLGTKTGENTNLLQSLIKGGGTAYKTLADLFSSDGDDLYTDADMWDSFDWDSGIDYGDFYTDPDMYDSFDWGWENTASDWGWADSWSDIEAPF